MIVRWGILCLILAAIWATEMRGQNTYPWPSTGNVGIGTTTPEVQLQNTGNGYSVGGTGYVNFEDSQDMANKRGVDLGWDTSGQIGIILGDSVGNPSNLAFWTWNGSSWGERMRLASNGSLGIGTTNPSAPIEVSTPTAGNPVVLKVVRTGGNASLEGPALELDDYASSYPQGHIYTKLNYIDTSNSNGSMVLGSHWGNRFLDELTLSNGNVTVNGSLKLTSGSGGSITFQDGTIQSTAYTGVTCGGDFAESVDVTGERAKYVPGDVLIVDPEHPGRFVKSHEGYSTAVTGIFSTRPGTIGRRQTGSPNPDEVPMAMIGIVPTKVSAENGPIHPGDLLVTSSTLGHAMKGTDRNRMLGAVIGKALGRLDSGTGVMDVVVTLQ